MTTDALPKYLKFVSICLNDLLSFFSLDDWPPETQDYFVELNGKSSITGYELISMLIDNGYEARFINDIPISNTRTKTIYHFFKKDTEPEPEIPINVDTDVEDI